ncbi:MAG: ATP-binding protein, partial [Thiohalocapsa sp.]
NPSGFVGYLSSKVDGILRRMRPIPYSPARRFRTVEPTCTPQRWRNTLFGSLFGLGQVSPMRIAALFVLLLLSPALPAQDRGEPYRVLLLHSHRSSLPANTDWYNGILRGFASAPDLRIQIDVEAPDLTRVDDADYVAELRRGYGLKYRDYRPELIIATYTAAFEFLFNYGEELFPGVPIVFCDADGRIVGAHTLPATMTGVAFNLDIAGAVELALALHPDTERVAVIVGAGAHGQRYERLAEQAFQSLKTRPDFVWLKGLPLNELLEAVSRLPAQTVILYLVQYQDRAGNAYTPRSILRDVVDVASVPTYGLWDTLIGTGIVGGRLVALEEDGFRAAQMGVRILRGEAPQAIPVVNRLHNPAIFDAPALARWRIDEDRLPAGSRIRNRQPSLLQEHPGAIATGALVIALQGLLIAALFVNRRRLQRAERALRDENARGKQTMSDMIALRATLARYGKQRSLGAMATAIAHEINQPLIAIQNYAQAATRRLRSGNDQTSKLQALFEKIEGQATRAGEITHKVRAFISTKQVALEPLPLCATLQEAVGMMELETERRGCVIDCTSAGDLPAVLADGLQVQLVLVNLLQNAIQSVCSDEASDRRVRVHAERINGEVQVCVSDRGPGVPSEQVEAIFEPLNTAKRSGMGMGLSICQDIIEAHGGRLWYEPNPAGGAMFCFTLRVASHDNNS